MIAMNDILLTYFDAQPASTSMPPTSTSAFVPTTSSMLTITRPLTGQPAPTQAAAEDVNTKSEGLSAAATGGLVAGITVAGIAVVALIVWFVIRRRRKAAQTSEALVLLSTQPDNSNEKTDYYLHHNHEPTHELQGDGPRIMNSRASNRMSELDTIRPSSHV
jgi:hypothetical protein